MGLKRVHALQYLAVRLYLWDNSLNLLFSDQIRACTPLNVLKKRRLCIWAWMLSIGASKWEPRIWVRPRGMYVVALGRLALAVPKAKIVSFLCHEDEQQIHTLPNPQFSKSPIQQIFTSANLRSWSADLLKCRFARMQICKNTAAKSMHV